MAKTTPYKYSSQDSPLTVANQYGITPNQLISANPGGYPFSTGQTINIPQPITYQQAFHQAAGPYLQGLMQPLNNQLIPRANIPQGGNKQPLHGTFGQGYNYTPAQPMLDVNGQPIGPHGTFGQSPNIKQPNIFEQLVGANTTPQYTPNNYNVNQRGRGFGQPERGVVPDNVGNQGFYQEQLQNALNSPDKPVVLSSFAMQSLGIDPAANGYTYENGNWVLASAADATTGTGPTTDNNWQTNPRLHMVVFNRHAKLAQNRFVTTEQWRNNAWRRKKQMAKGDRPHGRPDAGSMQQSLTGFGLVDFGASSG